jgi:hypothetical protein
LVWAVLDTLQAHMELDQGRPVELSSQQIIDCAASTGFMKDITDYISKKGLCSEADYPYESAKGQCRDSSCEPALPPGTLWQSVTKGDEGALAKALQKGPVAVTLNASPLMGYTGGIFDGECDATLDHSMVLVADTESYWKLKNSWGSSWGEQGYARLAKGIPKGECGLAVSPVYPELPSVEAVV